MLPSFHEVGESSGCYGLGVCRRGMHHVRLLHPHMLTTRLSRRPTAARDQAVIGVIVLQ